MQRQTVTTQFEPSLAQPYETYKSTNLRIKADTGPDAASDNTVCSIDYDALDRSFTSQYDLMKLPSGGFRYVSPTNGGLHFDVSYYHHELQKIIFLGRFTDERTASLAHAIARKNAAVRAIDNAAQDYIQSMLPSTSSTSNPVVPDDAPVAVSPRVADDPSSSPIPPLHAVNLFG